MTVEAIFALGVAWRAHSPALFAFGGDSAIELLSALVVCWRFRSQQARRGRKVLSRSRVMPNTENDSVALHSYRDAKTRAPSQTRVRDMVAVDWLRPTTALRWIAGPIDALLREEVNASCCH
jgi:hypothetical protein